MTGDTVVVDSSVLIAIFKNEPAAESLAARALSFQRRVISAPNWVESAMVCEGLKDLGGGARLDEIVRLLEIEILPFTPRQAGLAREAFKAFGKGREKPASLNFGDCFAYALAKDLDAPLLFKGNDFSQTHIVAA